MVFELLDRKRVVRPRDRSNGLAAWSTRRVSSPEFHRERRSLVQRVASSIDSGVIVFIVCDGGWKYLPPAPTPMTSMQPKQRPKNNLLLDAGGV